MADRENEPKPGRADAARPPKKSTTSDIRQARLAAALRENLRRRKKGKPDGKAG